MKHIKSALFILVLTFNTIACDYLGENPETSLSEATVYETEESLEALVRGVYATFYHTNMYAHNMFEFILPGSCLYFFPQGSVGANNTKENYYSAYHYSQSQNTTTNSNIYMWHYAGVSRCNKIIEDLPASPVEESYKKEIEGEAKFLRAVFYFSLVRFYGDVPLITSMPKSANDSDKKREDYANVYRQILADLDFAEKNMRTPARVNEVTPGASRPNCWAATAFKAAVYTQIGSYLSAPNDHAFGTVQTGPKQVDFSVCEIANAKDAWQLAYNCAVEVIENGPYRLADDYAQLFRWTNAEDYQLPERLFVIPISTSATATGQLAMRTLPAFPEGTQNTITVNGNYGRLRPTRFVFQKWCETYGGEKGTGTNNSNIYISSKDPRFNATFIHTRTKNMKTNSSYNIYPSNGQVLITTRGSYLPYFKKYLSPTYDANAGNADLYYMRFAEMYLLAAEAAAELSDGVGDEMWRNALEMIEVLHKRARTSVSPASDQPKWETDRFATKDELISGIMWERIFEMYGEGHEWFDTHRRGNNWFLNNIIKPMNASLAQPEQAEAIKWYGGSTPFSEDSEEVRKGLFNAIPLNEITYNTALDIQDQNYYTWK